ncbi:MAG: C1 family peptidase [Longimicrobiales bacterium]
MIHRIARGLGALTLLFLFAFPAAGQQDAAERQAFFDQIHAPNWLGTDIAHTSIKSQRGGTCWSFATVSFLEAEVLRQNTALAESLADARRELNISEYYVVYWAWVEKAREYTERRGEGFHPRRGEVPLGDGGLPHDVTRIVRDYGLVPEEAYVEPEDSRQMTRELLAAMAEADDRGWDVDATIDAVREVLDAHLAPPPSRVEVDGRTMTPKEYATDYLGLDPDAYVELMSYTDVPFYAYGEVDVPDNWWDYDEYVNVPLDAFVRIINRALNRGYSVAFDTDWGDVGAAWNTAGIAVIHPDMAPGYMIDQEMRQRDFEERRTTDDHLVHAVDHRVVDGRDWYLIKNSHGTSTGRRGYVWMRGDWLALRVLNVMVHKDAVDEDVLGRIQ